MSEANLRWVKVASVNDLADEPTLSVVVGTQKVGLFRVEDDIFALDDICTHGNALLTEGDLEGSEIECPLHGGVFDVCTGKALCDPVVKNATQYPIRIEDENILVGVTEDLL